LINQNTRDCIDCTHLRTTKIVKVGQMVGCRLNLIGAFYSQESFVQSGIGTQKAPACSDFDDMDGIPTTEVVCAICK
jgi:hypothetical protein